MSNQLAPYDFPDAYSTLVSNFSGTVKYVATTGSNSNDGNSVTTPYLTVDFAQSTTSATANVMIVVMSGTYTMTATSVAQDASVAITDGGKQRVYVGCPGKAIVQWTATTGNRDCCMVDFSNSSSAIYGLILKRNNNGRTGNYPTAYFRSYGGATKGNFYNCVFQETNANNNWSYQYDNYGGANFAVRNCTIYNNAAAIGNYTNAGTCLTIDTVFNTTCTTGGTETNVLKSQTVNSSTYVTTGVTTAGVYSGTYAWNGTITSFVLPISTATVSGTTGSPTIVEYNDGANFYKSYIFTQSGSITFGQSGNVNILAVGGGGGGVGAYGGNAVPAGGGGAGGLVYVSDKTLSAQAYTITVGAGGAKSAASVSSVGGSGGDTIFGSNVIVAKGGGGGGWYTTGAAGGSGGGGGYNGSAGGATTQNTLGVNGGGTGYGNIGGTGATISTGSGGGGGAGSAGVAASGVDGSAGGTGRQYNLSGVNAWYAGGGGGGGSYSSGGTGGAGGSGVGGTGGSSSTNATSGAINTGSGGGGAPNSYLGGDGGSGIVIVNFVVAPTPGLKFSANTVLAGGSLIATLISASLASGNVAYTLTGVTSSQVSTPLTGNFVLTSNTGSITITSINYQTANYQMMLSADGYTANATITPNTSISNTVTHLGQNYSNSGGILDINGQMNVYQSLTTTDLFMDGVSAYDINGQMNVYQSLVNTLDTGNTVSMITPKFGDMLANTVVSYNTMTDKIAGPVDVSCIKLFGDYPQREYWM